MNFGEQNLTGRQGIRQETIVLPYFDEEMSVLYLADGTAYLPVRALCRMLGLRAETCIPRWRRLVLWTNACKLSLQTAKGERIVWCLHMGALPFWCACFNWSLVPGVRREQLRQATDAWLKDVARAQQLLLDRYRALRRYLFAFLEEYNDTETRLDQWARRLSSSLDGTTFLQLTRLISQGKTHISQATSQARKMVQEQAMAPIIDIVTLDESGEVSETDTLPLFPVVIREDGEQFFAHMEALTQWHRDMAAFIDNLILSLDSDQSGEA